jgi:hypothetical protein
MKRKITFIILVFFFANLSYSQNKKDSLKAYNEIKNWAVARLTIAYIEDYKGWDDSKPDLKTKNEQDEWDSYKKIKNKYSKYSNNVNLDTLNNELSIAWSKTRDNVFNKYKLELIDSITRFNFKKIVFIPSKNSNKETSSEELKKRTETIQAIKEQYNYTLKIFSTENIADENVLKNAQNTNTRRTSNSQEFSTFPLVLLILSLIFNLFLIINLRSSKKKKGSRRTETSENYTKLDNAYQNSQNENRSLKKENEDFNQQIRDLKERISQYSNSVNILVAGDQIRKDEVQNTFTQNDIENKETQFVEEEKSITNNLDIHKQKTTLIYLPSPFEERRFAIEDASPAETPTSLYVVNVHANTYEGDITLIETADLSRALNSPNIYLETVCEYENAYNSEAKGIKVVEDGEVVLEGEDWVVKSKIKIKFI